jgi:hypothetical protein
LKVQIIQLNTHDDHVSARDKMAWSRAHRLLLVWPDRGHLLERRLDLVLLERQATRQGAQLGIICQDPAVIEHAMSLGIACFSSTQHLPERIWKSAQRRRLKLRKRLPAGPPPAKPLRPAAPRPPGRLQRLLAGGLALGALLSLAAALLPAAEIRLQPTTQPLSTQLTILIGADEASGDLAENTLAVRSLKMELSTSGRQAATGARNLPDQAASGSVVFTNLTDQPLTIPKETGIRAGQAPEAPRFVTLQVLELPAGKGSTLEATVMADSPGVGGNLPSHSLDSVEGDIGLSLSVDNPQPMSGGTQRRVPAVSAGDLEELQARLTTTLISEASEAFKDSLPSGERLAPSSVGVTEVEQATFDHDAGDVAESVGLELKLSLLGLSYKIADFNLLAASALGKQVPQGWELVPGSLDTQVGEANSYILPGGKGGFSAQVSGRIFRPIDENNLRQQVSGLTTAQAMKALSRHLDLVQSPSIFVHPSWYPRLPWLPMRIAIELQWGGN